MAEMYLRMTFPSSSSGGSCLSLARTASAPSWVGTSSSSTSLPSSLSSSGSFMSSSQRYKPTDTLGTLLLKRKSKQPYVHHSVFNGLKLLTFNQFCNSTIFLKSFNKSHCYQNAIQRAKLIITSIFLL